MTTRVLTAMATNTTQQTTTATMATETSFGIIVGSHHGNGENHKENCDSSNKYTIHLRFLQEIKRAAAEN